jgi:glutamyl/glutaminyl-tRNA synthetase
MENFENFDNIEAIQEHLLALVQKLELKNGQVLWPLRAALTGEQYSPGVFEMMWALGKEESLKRIEEGLKKL